MRYLLILAVTIVVLPVIFKEPAVKAQSKDPTIVTPIELKEARVLGAENDKRSLAINKDIAIAASQTVPNNKLRSELLRFKKMAYALQRENGYYKRKIVTLKKVLKKNYSMETALEKYLPDSIIYKIDTLYLPSPKKPIQKKGFFRNLFN